MYTDIDYIDTRFNNRFELFNKCFQIYQFTQEEFLLDIRKWLTDEFESGLRTSSIQYAMNIRKLVKQELENILEEYDVKKTATFNHSLEGFTGYREGFEHKELEIWELVYHHVFHDQPEYRPELIRTPIEDLKAGKYI